MPEEELSEPLQVGVSNGKWPVGNTLVIFEVKDGEGRLSTESP